MSIFICIKSKLVHKDDLKVPRETGFAVIWNGVPEADSTGKKERKCESTDN